jgi:hypothetical protein
VGLPSYAQFGSAGLQCDAEYGWQVDEVERGLVEFILLLK